MGREEGTGRGGGRAGRGRAGAGRRLALEEVLLLLAHRVEVLGVGAHAPRRAAERRRHRVDVRLELVGHLVDVGVVDGCGLKDGPRGRAGDVGVGGAEAAHVGPHGWGGMRLSLGWLMVARASATPLPSVELSESLCVATRYVQAFMHGSDFSRSRIGGATAPPPKLLAELPTCLEGVEEGSCNGNDSANAAPIGTTDNLVTAISANSQVDMSMSDNEYSEKD